MDIEDSNDAVAPGASDSDDVFDGFEDNDSDTFSDNDTDLHAWQYCGYPAHSAIASDFESHLSTPWRPLNVPYQFRVLEVEEAKSSTDPILVRLVTRTLDSPGEFCALSYTWGEEDLTQLVYCGDHRISVTANLHSALLVIRDLFHSSGKIMPEIDHSTYIPVSERDAWRHLQPYIWVDAICIDQKDHAERSRQVMIMDRIFSAARHLFIWLGRPYERVIRESMATNASSLHVLRRVLDAPWFQRRWVIQEANVMFVRRSIITNRKLLNLSNLHNEITATGDLEMFSTSPLAESLEQPLLAQLLRYENALCRDPRDLVYALSNISSDKLAIVPDYTKSPEEVFIDLAGYCVASGQVLPLMACAIARPLFANMRCAKGDSIIQIGPKYKETRHCISWIPDWRLLRSSKEGQFSFTMCETAARLPETLATLPLMQASVTQSPMPNTLVLKGWLLGGCETARRFKAWSGQIWSSQRDKDHQPGCFWCAPCLLRTEWQITKIKRELPDRFESSGLKMLCLPHTDFSFLVQEVSQGGHAKGRVIPLHRLVTYFRRDSVLNIDSFKDSEFEKFVAQDPPKLAFLWDEEKRFPGYPHLKVPEPEEVYIT